MNKQDYYKGQFPSQADFDNLQENIDGGIKDFLLAHGYQGVVAGLVATALPGAPTFNLIITAGTAYDKDGEHCYVATNQTIDVSVDELGATTYTDLGGGEDRWVSIFLHFDRAQSDPHPDDDGVTVYFVQAESFTLRVVNGTKGAAPVTEPALDANDILLADLYMYNGMADVIATDIHVHRREEIGYYRSATGGLVKHKNDTMDGPDTDTIEDTWADANAISQTKHYGARTVEVRDRQHGRNTTRLVEFEDDFFNSTLQDWWNPTLGGFETVGVNISLPGGGYQVQLDNGAAGDWLVEGYVLTALQDGPSFELSVACADAPDAEHALFFGIEVVTAATHNHTEEGFGFYHNNGNWFAANSSAVPVVTATDTGVAVDVSKFQRLRAHCIVDSAGTVTKILFYINDSLVATHTTNLPTTAAAAFQPFIHYDTTAGPQTANKVMALDRFFMSSLRKYYHE